MRVCGCERCQGGPARGCCSENRGDRSVKVVVNPRGEPCSLKRHFKGCLRQVVGYLDLLASRDHERFAWAKPDDIQKHTRKYKGGGMYVRSQVYLSLKLAQERHVIEPAWRLRGGHMLKGYVVVAHGAITSSDGRTCTLWPNTNVRNRFAGETPVNPKAPPVNPTAPFPSAKSVKNSRQIGQENSLIGQKNLLIRQSIGQNLNSDQRRNRTANRTQEAPQNFEDIAERGDHDAVLSAGLSTTLKASIPVIPVKSSLLLNPGSEPAGACAPSPFSKDDLTVSGSLRSPGGNGKILTDSQTQTDTVGDHLNLCSLTDSEIIEAVTDGEFDSSYLDRYKQTDLLADCCVAAAGEYEVEPYRGRCSLAAVMGRAMELLRDHHGLDAPRGWVPIIKTLRQGGLTHEDAKAQFRLTPIEPERLFTDGGSTLAFWSCAEDDSLRKTAEADPELMALLIDTARKRGVPEFWPEALAFGEAVIQELETRGLPIPAALNEFREAMKVRTGELVTCAG